MIHGQKVSKMSLKNSSITNSFPGGSVVKNSYLSHLQWVPTVMWSTDNEFLFISGSYDNEVKLWDHRR